jgi:uncharacterized protein
MMTREAIQQQLAQLQPDLAQFDVHSLALFGSVARGEATADSDLDLLVTFNQPATFANYMGLKIFLEDTLGYPIDLVTAKALRPPIKATIERELAYVFP